ncbi:MAG: zinc-ribbon domain-containing protein, partial [Myxococcota bacterium]|nr:zinc-ribbon domain-containing protein [Myxococcota bacterium]
MTVFCPNCGKPNTDTATQCVACATALKPKAAGSKFKGTMMMTGVAAPKPGAPGGPPPGGPPPGP